jgi:hypothetical protein
LVAVDLARKNLMALVPETSTASSTWIFDGRSWARATTAINPPAPYGAGMAYDPASSTVVAVWRPRE